MIPSTQPGIFRASLASWLSGILRFCLALVLAGCAVRPGADVLIPTHTTAPDARQVTIYVATTRARETPTRNDFTDGRSMQMNYAAFTISIPPHHKAGRIEWPNGDPNPATTFVTVRQSVLDRAAFMRAVERAPHKQPPQVGVYVHGYNTSFQEALFRMAQMTADSDADTTGAPILFSWPSDAHVAAYVADKDAATFSRDQLTRLFTMLATDRRIRGVTVIGHSMGAWLTTEALRQLRLSHKDAVLKRLHVILAAPDIDVDVFRSQVATIGPMSPPLTILVSRDDGALSVSRLLAGSRQRVGALNVGDPRVIAAARKAKVQIVDISNVNATGLLGHSRYEQLAALYPKLNAEAASRGSNLRKTGAYIFNRANDTLTAPIEFAGNALPAQYISRLR